MLNLLQARFLAPFAMVVCIVPIAPPTETYSAWAQDHRAAPESSTGRTIKGVVTAQKTMVTAANPIAAQAGRTILRKGGSAIDAAIAVQLVLNLVEPQSSGIGGGAFVLHWDNHSRELKTYDGRETAPSAATPDRFLLDGQPMPFKSAVKSGLSVGVPGLVKLLELVHARHGKLPWPELFSPAIQLARDGFPVSRRLHQLLWLQTAATFSPAARRYFFAESTTASTPQPHPVGHNLKNPEFAVTLAAIRDRGSAAFYQGSIAHKIVAAVQTAPRNAGDITLADLQAYNVKERPPICMSYRRHRICGMGPPSSGGLTVAQALKMVEYFDLGRSAKAALNPQAMHLMSEALKLAFADRNRYIADTDFV
ncbi:MAG: gamma-glutamyltransferase family protein, partial [Hyphomicrobiaceae bacterium]